ncbi:MAG: thiol:disulfide interchange protein, partial [Paludibacteraceae bacterium]|nr:thiol:disulfide interchange protein [Paludibacteraceae bacterium]
MLKKLFLLISLLWAISSTAQIMDPVQWTISEKLTSSQTLQITATATIDEGWHIYDQNLPENGPVSTKFFIEEKKNIKKVGSVTSNIKPIEKYEEMFGMN